MDEFDARRASLDLVTAFVNNNALSAGELPALLRDVFAAISGFAATTSPIRQPADESTAALAHEPTKDSVETPIELITGDRFGAAPKSAALTRATSSPVVSVRDSLADPTVIVSLITGESFKTLKRHLAKHGLTEAEYKARFNLPDDYPTVAPAYAEVRRKIALARTSKATDRKTAAGVASGPAAGPAAAMSSAADAGSPSANSPSQVDPARKVARQSGLRRPSSALATKANLDITAASGTPSSTGQTADGSVVAGSAQQTGAKAPVVNSARKRRMARPTVAQVQSAKPVSPAQPLPELSAVGSVLDSSSQQPSRAATEAAGDESSLIKSSRKARRKLSVKFG